MSCKTGLVGDVHIARWIYPEAEDVERLVREVEAEWRGSRQVVSVIIIDDSVPLPSSHVHRTMMRLMGRMLKACREMHVVITGRGLKAASLRSAHGAVAIAGRVRGDEVRVHRTVEAAFAAAGVNVEETMRLAVAAGLVERANKVSVG